MSAPPRPGGAAGYAPPRGAGEPPDTVAEAPPEPTEVRLVSVDAQVVSPAWELELLVTGIVLVGLFQIPPWLQGIWHHWEPHLSLAAAVAGRTLAQAVLAALYALIICFTVALALRGYWVALVGVNAVFPHGVRWDKQREYGRIQTEIMRPRVRPLPSFIGRANDAASLVFATGFFLAAAVASSFGLLAAIVVVMGLLSVALPVKAALIVFGVLTASALIAVLGAAITDIRRGAHLAPGGRPERFVRTVLRAAGALTPDGVRSLGAVLTSNLNRRVAYAALSVGIIGAYAAAFAAMADPGAPPARFNYTYFADGRRPGVVTADLYDSMRAADASPTLPSIQSDVIVDPYVRLFVPYRPASHNVALRRVCPTLRPPENDDDAPGVAAGDDAILACVARLHAVTLDGRPAGGRFRFFTNPRTERRGFLMLIPAANLASGEHVIGVHPARRAPAPGDTAPVRIPFWR